MRRLLIVVLVSLSAVGCAGVVRQSFSGTGNTEGNLAISDPALNALVRIEKSDGAVVDGLLTANILLVNRTHLRRQIEWKVLFFDSEGHSLEDPYGWRPLSLEPHGREWIRAKSPSARAVRFDLVLQRASEEDVQ